MSEYRTTAHVRTIVIVTVQNSDVEVAEAHGRLLAHIHRAGAKRGAHDLIIAATAVVTRRTLVTTDRSARFQDLPGVDCVVISQL